MENIKDSVQIACQPSVDQRLNDSFYLGKTSNQGKGGYCTDLFNKIDDAERLDQDQFKVCEVVDCGEACDGCSIRYYYNGIDEDDFFGSKTLVSKLKIRVFQIISL